MPQPPPPHKSSPPPPPLLMIHAANHKKYNNILFNPFIPHYQTHSTIPNSFPPYLSHSVSVSPPLSSTFIHPRFRLRQNSPKRQHGEGPESALAALSAKRNHHLINSSTPRIYPKVYTPGYRTNPSNLVRRSVGRSVGLPPPPTYFVFITGSNPAVDSSRVPPSPRSARRRIS